MSFEPNHAGTGRRLVLRGAAVYLAGRPESLDVAVDDARVAEIAPSIASLPSDRVVDLRGKLLVPGLIDFHCHVFWGIGVGAPPDEVGLARGCTAVLDAGSAGALTFDGFRRYIVPNARTRVAAWLHLATPGLIDLRCADFPSLTHADADAAIATIRAHPDLIVGLKIRLSDFVVGLDPLPYLKIARSVCDACQVPLMVHIGDAGVPLPRILDLLKEGDVVSHCYTGRRNGIVDLERRIIPEVRQARQRGVLFDLSTGMSHFDLPIARAAIEQEFYPDCISTDLAQMNLNGQPHFHIPGVMSRLMALGMPFSELLASATTRPAAAARGLVGDGAIKVGGPADITVLEQRDEAVQWVDVAGHRAEGQGVLVPTLVVRNGVLTPCVGSAMPQS